MILKKLGILTLLFFFYSNSLKGQNLVVNPSFEEYLGKKRCASTVYATYPNSPVLQDSFTGWWQGSKHLHIFSCKGGPKATVDNRSNFSVWPIGNLKNSNDPLVKGHEAYHGNAALFLQSWYFSNILDSTDKSSQSFFGGNNIRNTVATGSVENPLVRNTPYFFSVFLSPRYAGYLAADPSNPTTGSVFPFLTADFGFGMFSEKTRKNFEERIRKGITYDTLKTLWINDPNNFISTNEDSLWVEVRFVFKTDSNYSYFFFGDVPNSLKRPFTAKLAPHVNYEEPYFSHKNTSFARDYFLDAFTLMPYPELGDTLYLCGDSLVLDPNTPNNSLKWFNGSTNTSQSVYEPGKYWVTAYSEFTSIADTVVVIRQKLPQLPTDTVLCTQQSNTISLTAGSKQIKWNTGDTTSLISIKTDGIYSVAYQYENCLLKDTITVKLDSLLLPNFKDTIICEQESLLIEVVPVAGQFYTWNNGMGNSLKVSLTEPLRNTLNVENKNCKDSVSFNLEVERKVKLNYNDTTLCNESSLSIAPKIPFDWKINNGSINEEISVTTAQDVIVSWQQPICGSVSDTISIDFENCNCEAYVPDIFSPNGDGLNDSFQAKFACGAEQINFRVYNRWGQRVFASNSANESWTGTNIPIDAYYWVLSYRGAYDRKDYFLHGFIQVIK